MHKYKVQSILQVVYTGEVGKEKSALYSGKYGFRKCDDLMLHNRSTSEFHTCL